MFLIAVKQKKYEVVNIFFEDDRLRMIMMKKKKKMMMIMMIMMMITYVADIRYGFQPI